MTRKTANPAKSPKPVKAAKPAKSARSAKGSQSDLPAFVPDWDETPCPQPVMSTSTPAQTSALTEGVRMRENPAEWAFVRLSKLIEDFEKGLDKDEEIGARVVGIPGDGIMAIEDVGFWNPDFIVFLGRSDGGKPVRLIQHYSQINVLLAVRKKPEEREARRIGFQLSELVKKTNPKKKTARPAG